MGRKRQVTIYGGCQVYVAVWEAAVGQILPCQQEGDNIHDPRTVTVNTVAIGENNDTLNDNNAPHSMKTFTVKTSVNCPNTAKFAKVFTCKRFPLYGILVSCCKLILNQKHSPVSNSLIHWQCVNPVEENNIKLMV